MEKTKPMLATEAILGQITYPKLASPKYNGCRAIHKGEFLARSLKKFPNAYVNKLFDRPEYAGLDGEVIVGDPCHPNVFVATGSGVGSMGGEPDVVWYVFDHFQYPYLTYHQRLNVARAAVEKLNDPRVKMIEQRMVMGDEEADAYMKHCVARGFEGIVLRDPEEQYVYNGRTQGFQRLCPWLRSEAVIFEVVEGMTNNNPVKISELGYQKRSTHKANKVPNGKAGALRCKDLKTGLEVSIATSTDEECKWFWENREEVKGWIVKYKFREPVKIGGLPRFPQYEGVRKPFDMGE